MTIKTDKGTVWEADWITGASGLTRQVAVRIRDERPLSELAAEAEGVRRLTIHRLRGETTTYAVAGLAGLTREGDAVTLRLLPGGDGHA